MSIPDDMSMIYRADNYKDALGKDLAEANKYVAIAGPWVSKTQANKVRQYLSSNSVKAELLPANLIFIIIDKRIVWYGEINFFGRNSGSETCLRIDNRELAEELLECAREGQENEQK
jgi:hypothetical protein